MTMKKSYSEGIKKSALSFDKADLISLLIRCKKKYESCRGILSGITGSLMFLLQIVIFLRIIVQQVQYSERCSIGSLAECSETLLWSRSTKLLIWSIIEGKNNGDIVWRYKTEVYK